MNNIRAITLNVLRNYSTKRKFAGVRKTVNEDLTDDNKYFEPDPEDPDFNPEDMGQYETDLTDIAGSYISEKRKVDKTRQLLPMHIVKTKFFKETQPRFLTYIEIDQIKKLHEDNPDEWTPEKLSESFPALPETIRKVLKTRWIPRSAEQIIQYDERTIENWKQFKTGQLALSPILRTHLTKFKNRKISLMDKETLEQKFVPKIEFPKPRSSFFSSIVKKKSMTNDKLLIPSGSNKDIDEKNLKGQMKDKESAESLAQTKVDMVHSKTDRIRKYKDERKRLVFDDFLKKKLNNPEEMSVKERMTVMDTYKKHMESKNTEDINFNILNNDTKDSDAKDLSSENTLIVKRNDKRSEITTDISTHHLSSLDTYVKKRISHIDTKLDYAKPLRIPRNVYKAGSTYRIKDCYYDSDGEFLFRVPGLIH